MTTLDIVKINKEVASQLANKEVLQSLIATTFKGLEPENVKKAVVEGMIRGFTFENFLKKDLYAIPFGKTYSLVTSIDYARKMGMRSGVVGKSEPTYEEKDGKIISCSITIKRKIEDYVGDYTAKVYFAEYTTGRNLWTSKPRTMIGKVAEVHALRSACPEEMSQVYVEEEMVKEIQAIEKKEIDPALYETKLNSSKTLAELSTAWSALPFEMKGKLAGLKDELKAKLTPTK